MKKYFNLFIPSILYVVFFLLLTAVLGGFIVNFDINAVISCLTTFIIIAIIFKNWKRFIRFEKIKVGHLIIGVVIFFVFFVIIKYLRAYLYGYFIDLNNIEFKMKYSYYRVVSLIIFAPIFEEIISRGTVIEKAIEDKLNVNLVIIVSSLLFGLGHSPDIFNIFTFTIFGLILSYYYLYTRNLWYIIIMHVFYNLLTLFI